MAWYLLLISAVICTVFGVPQGIGNNYKTIELEDRDFWRSSASARLAEVLKRQSNNKVAKNVIVFIGDGMGMTTITAGRIYQGQLRQRGGEGNSLSFDKFPVTGLAKTYNVNTQVPDSASTATAIFSGVKTKHYVLGLDATAAFDNCIPEMNKQAAVTNVMNWAQDAGKDTGIVTTTRITHATPAATYSHINNRNWECDSLIPSSDVGCVKDIARQLVEDAPGKNFKVILGGGRNQLGDAKVVSDYCVRNDNRNLVSEWKNAKVNARYVTTANELSAVDVKKTDYLLGLFSPGHISYAAEKDPIRPSLKLMTEAAIRMLQKNGKGFVLMVEGGRIDHGHHNNTPGLALSELVDLDEAVEAAVNLTSPDDTLIIVTADHSHAMSFNGYPNRGNDILGLAHNESNAFYETLSYANGPGFADHHLVNKQENCIGVCTENEKESANSWKDIRKNHTGSNNPFYRHLAAVYLVEETHGGEDVPIYASGPMSHLLSGVHEQNYIASVISYASCIGPEAKRCGGNRVSSSSSSSSTSSINNSLLISILSFTAFYLNL
ncbi:UNVERIFIED_CONTAM: hypothetical protein PYX00_010751 [Menopon gallinae]|uniref:Alkaline phosphatase n=1 Tax=Menopon gallinae TaxID=328185 RepID=A0AAW2HGQ0_9NEOP